MGIGYGGDPLPRHYRGLLQRVIGRKNLIESVGGEQVLVNSEKENKTMTREQQIKTIDTKRSIDIAAFIYRTIDRALKEIYHISNTYFLYVLKVLRS